MLTGSGGVPADPSWATISSPSVLFTRIASTSVTDAGQYDFVYTAMLNDDSYPSGATGSSTFSVFMIAVITSTVTDMQLSLN